MSTDRIDKVRELLGDVEAAYQDAAASGKSAPGIAALARQRLLLLEKIHELEDANATDEEAQAFADMEAEDLAELAGEFIVQLPDPLLDQVLTDLVRAGKAGALRRNLPEALTVITGGKK